MGKTSIKQTIINWDNKYPIDLWFRKKYNIPFGSEKHRQSNFYFMCMEFVEFVELLKNNEKERKVEEDDFYNDIPVTGEGKEIITMDSKEIEDEFENLDLDKFN
jgi:hypothetical protein